MNTALESLCFAALGAETMADLEHAVFRFTGELGFQTVTAMTVLDQPAGEPTFLCIDNAPAEFSEAHSDYDRAKRDPVMQHCKHKSVPIAWNQRTYLEAGEIAQWEEQAQFGYRHGIAFAMHMPHGRHFFLGLDRDQPLGGPVEVIQAISSLLMFGVYAQDAAMRLLVPESAQQELPALTPRELETLRWTSEGKTSWEVGRILNIAENTVVRHAQSATHKLECTNKHHAAVKALRLGLIT